MGPEMLFCMRRTTASPTRAEKAAPKKVAAWPLLQADTPVIRATAVDSGVITSRISL